MGDERRSVEIYEERLGQTRIVVDGKNLTGYVSRYEIDRMCGDVARVTISMVAPFRFIGDVNLQSVWPLQDIPDSMLRDLKKAVTEELQGRADQG